MTQQLATTSSIGQLMFGGKNNGGSNVKDYPYIKFYNGEKTKIELVQFEGEGEERKTIKTPMESFKARILFKTTIYEHAFSDGESYKVLGTSSEFFDWEMKQEGLDPKFYNKPFFFFNKETKNIQEGCYKQWDIRLNMNNMETIKRKDVLYMDVDGVGIVKTYLRITQTIGKTKVGNNYEFRWRSPIAGGIEDTLKTYGTAVFDNVFTFTADTYKSWPTSTTVYPVLSEPVESPDPEVAIMQGDIFSKIYRENQELYSRGQVWVEEEKIFDKMDGNIVGGEVVLATDEEMPF